VLLSDNFDTVCYYSCWYSSTANKILSHVINGGITDMDDGRNSSFSLSL
jgi:hypothetical protein